jgi:4-amino-4-deoxy-L-arabinose transferase-like glycosyltransferase
VAAILAAGAVLAVYVPTLAPSVGFSDWGEMAVAPYRLDVAHPTGYPLYILLGKLWSFLPLGSVAWRANLLSAVTASLAVAVAVLIAGRLGVRPLAAAIAGLCLGVAGAVWNSATLAEVNALHLALMGLVIWLALRWRDEHRLRDAFAAAFLLGLATSNHLLALTVAVVVVPWGIAVGWRTLRERPMAIAVAGALGLVGLSPYLLLPIRGALGPPGVYGFLTTWDGFVRVATGSDWRRQIDLLSGETLAASAAFLPRFATTVQTEANLVFLGLGLAGTLILLVRDRAAGILLLALAAVNIVVYVSYRSELVHYLLLTWLILAVWLGVAVEWLVRRLPRPARPGLVVLVALPIWMAVANFPRYDRSDLRTGDQLIEQVFTVLPPNAVLFTYWDLGTALEYAQCVEGRRPDVVVLAPRDWVSYRPCHYLSEAEVAASDRPVFALVVQQGELDRYRDTYRLTPVGEFTLPYGRQEPRHVRSLYQLERRKATGVVLDSPPLTATTGRSSVGTAPERARDGVSRVGPPA